MTAFEEGLASHFAHSNDGAILTNTGGLRSWQLQNQVQPFDDSRRIYIVVFRRRSN